MILALPVLSHSMLMLSEEELACAADPDAETQWWHFVARKFNQLISASGFGPSFGCADPGMESKALQRDTESARNGLPDDRSEAGTIAWSHKETKVTRGHELGTST